jgi:[ribosomal protein S5]-alanine N-acetyltransferase
VTTAPEILTTARMRGERLGPAHQGALAPILADPRVAATMGGVASAAEVAEQLASFEEQWDREGFGYWMFFDARSGDPLARGGLSRTEFDGRPEVEVGWTVVPERWGQGLATELGAAAVEVAFADLGLADVVAFTLPDNAASRRVMEKLGFEYEKTAPYKTYGDHVLYRRRS